MPIGSIPGAIAPATTPASSASTGSATGAAGFGESLARMVNTVDASSEVANAAIDKMIDGTGDVHTAMIALQRAELSLQLTVQVRNKLVQAYQDIMKMPV
jgi:flagellar hook-basal body complex protein FliE